MFHIFFFKNRKKRENPKNPTAILRVACINRKLIILGKIIVTGGTRSVCQPQDFHALFNECVCSCCWAPVKPLDLLAKRGPCLAGGDVTDAGASEPASCSLNFPRLICIHKEPTPCHRVFSFLACL